MGETRFIHKQPGEKFNASDYMSFVDAINNLENAININIGSSTASIPSSNLAGNIPGTKIDPSSNLTIQNLLVNGTATINKDLLLGSLGSINLNNQDRTFFQINSSSVSANNGSNTTFLIDSSGEVSLNGYIESNPNSILRGMLYASSGNISGPVYIGNESGIVLDGSLKQIRIDEGNIVAGNSRLDASGIHILQGDINLGSEASSLFSVNNSGSVIIRSGDISGKIVSTTGSIGGITITSQGLSTAGYSLNNNGYVSFSNGSFTGSMTMNNGTIVNANVTGKITASGIVIDNAGLALTKGSINLGNGKFVVDNLGRLFASEVNIHGNIIANTGSVTGTFTAGSVTMSPDGLRVSGPNGIRVDTGAIEVWEGTESPTKVLTMGEYLQEDGETKDHGMLVTNVFGDRTFIVNREGNVSIKGYIETASGSKIDGDITARTGNFYSVNIKDLMTILPGGKIKAGTSELTDTGINLTSGSITLGNKFSVNNEGKVIASDVDLSGKISATAGDIAGILTVGPRQEDYTRQLRLDGNTGKIIAGGTVLTSEGITISEGTINLGNGKLIVSSTGDLIAESANIKGHLEVMSANILGTMLTSGAIINQNGIEVTGEQGIKIKNGTLSILNADSTEIIRLGNFIDVDSIQKYGMVVKSRLNSNDIRLKIDSDGNVELKGVVHGTSGSFSGTISANSGTFGTGTYKITADENGLWSGSKPGESSSVFWIATKSIINPKYVPGGDEPEYIAHQGDAFFKGSVEVSQDSAIQGGDLVINEGNIIAGDPAGAHVKMSFHKEDHIPEGDRIGGEISAWSYNHLNQLRQSFRINRQEAMFRGELNATSGRIEGELYVGNNHNINLSGTHNQILLIDNEDANKRVRLTSHGLEVSTDGSTWQEALTGGGVNANSIRDGVLTITDTDGQGVSGISIRKYNPFNDKYVENISITPAGISIYDGALTVYNENTGEAIIGGGYLRVKGLDMGVVTSNNFAANGNFQMISEDYGLRRTNKGEVFLGTTHSSGGAVSNPTYHYVGWPDHGDLYPHHVLTFDVDPVTGLIDDWDPTSPPDYNKESSSYNPHPVKQRVSFNPQWSVCHPIYEYCIVPNDACNFITILDKNGNAVRNMPAWKGGLFGADFTPNGDRLVVAADDIDRKRGPWDVVIFDTSNADPNKWTRLGCVQVGEFPCKVACDHEYAYVSVSTDKTLYKIDIYNLRIDKVLTMPNERPPHVPMPLEIDRSDYQHIYVGAVTSDYIFKIPTSFDVPIEQCDKFHTFPYEGERAMIHDIDIDSINKVMIISNASTRDGSVVILDIDPNRSTYGQILSYLDETTIDRLAIPGDASQSEKDNWNFKSTTTLAINPNKKLAYATVTNRCKISIISYEDFETDPNTGEVISCSLVETARIITGSNPSGVTISNDGTKLYVPNHHYHTYPLGPNRIWGYDVENENYYCTPDVFDTSQKFWHYNPSGMALIDYNGRQYLFVANRATNEIRIINDAIWDNTNNKWNYINDNWNDENSWKVVKDVGHKPYAIKRYPQTHSKVIITNDDSYNLTEPDHVTIIDVAKAINGEECIDAKILVRDTPMGVEISDDEKYAYIACLKGQAVQKANLENYTIVSSVDLLGGPRYLKLLEYNGKKMLFVTCADSNQLHVLNPDSLDIEHTFETLEGPSQMAYGENKLYIVNKGNDTVQVFDLATMKFTKAIKVGSMPEAIAYNKTTNIVHVGNAGEGSCCLINAVIDEVVEWIMAGHSPQFITVTDDGKRWYLSAHGPKDIYSYGHNTDYTGDAYLDNNNKTLQYGAAFWMPNRSEWHRAQDNTLTGFSSVEFWPDGVLHDKQGYSHLTVSGIYDSFAQIEQDVYSLTNSSDGASDIKSEVFDLSVGEYTLAEDPADFRFLRGTPEVQYKTPMVSCVKTGKFYTEKGMGGDLDEDFTIDYSNKKIFRSGALSEIPRRESQTGLILTGTEFFNLNYQASLYNTIEVYKSSTNTKYIESTDGGDTGDFIIDYQNNKIARTSTSHIKDGEAVDIIFRHFVRVRYYYHPNRRNYEDVILSADFFWRWPRPENQWVTMEVDELVPKFVIVDNEQISKWTPIGDNIRDTYKPLRFSANSDRSSSAIFSASANPTSGSVHSLSVGNGIVELPSGEQYIQADLGSVYYINNILVKHDPNLNNYNGARVEISRDGITWEKFNGNSSAEYNIEFTEESDGESYAVSKLIRYIRCYLNGNGTSTFNRWKQISIMGDWKLVTSYIFARDTLWDSEGTRESCVTINGTTPVRYDGATQLDDKVRYRCYYTKEDNGKITEIISGHVEVWDFNKETIYVKDQDYSWDHKSNTISRIPEGRIKDGELLYINYKFVQEDLSQEPVAMRSRNPVTGKFEGAGSVAESDVTGAWIEWDFHNEYRSDWYVGWVADIGMGQVNVFMDGELVHDISQTSSKVERFSQVTHDLAPGKHTIRIKQSQGKVNFDRIKLEDYQLAYQADESGSINYSRPCTNTKFVASPTLNPVELFSWYSDKVLPSFLKNYLGKGSQTTSGAYEAPRVDQETRLPNRMVPIKYRIRFKTELRDRGVPGSMPDYGSGGELGDRASKFENGSVLITNVNFEKGVNPTYWRMAPSADKYPGFAIETWDPKKPSNTGIQSSHLANGSVTKDKIKSFSIKDLHVDNNANIQESKLALNYPTHPHLNKGVIDKLSSSEDGTLLFNGEHIAGKIKDGIVDSDLLISGNLSIVGSLREKNKYDLVHCRPIFGIGGDLEFQTSKVTWETLTKEYWLFKDMPSVKADATRYYKLFLIWSDNCNESNSERAWIRIIDDTTGNVLLKWKLQNTGDADGTWRRSAFSEAFKTTSQNHFRVEVRIQNSSENLSSNSSKWVEVHYAEIKAYDVYES